MSALTATPSFIDEFTADVLRGLSLPRQKELPSKYLYDAVGSALFEVITELPEYGVTRAEQRILKKHAREIVARFSRKIAIAELGSGSGRKTRYLLEALRRPAMYYPIEVSSAALAQCARELSGIDCIAVVGLESDYLDGLTEVARRRAPGQQLGVLFLGSTIGNFERQAAITFLRRIRDMLAAGDVLVMATDLMKPIPILMAAYDDPLGVTAAFNRNLLVRINRELHADFDIAQFAHQVRFNEEQLAIEMHLRSLRAQTVHIGGRPFEFREGETIWTESCHKYLPEHPAQMASASGFRCDRQWIERDWGFAENLFVAV